MVWPWPPRKTCIILSVDTIEGIPKGEGAHQVVATLYNRQTRFNAGLRAMECLKLFFRFQVPNYQFMPKYKAGLWDGWITLLRRNTVPTGLFLQQRAELEQQTNLCLEVLDLREPVRFRALPATLAEQLWPHQLACIEKMLEGSHTGGLVLNATGTGKTRIAAGYFSRLQGRACFIVDELTLLEQARQALQILGEPIGMVGDSVFEPRRITVATVQTLSRHLQCSGAFHAWLRRLDVVVIDEIHLALNRRTQETLARIQPKAVFGLTATLELQKPEVALPAYALTGPVIFEYPLATGVSQGLLSRGVAIRIPFVQAGHRRTSYQEDYRALISHNSARNDLIETLVREGLRRGRRIVVLVERLAHLHILGRRLADVAPQLLCGAYRKEIRFAAKAAMDSGALNLILATRIFGKGIDIRAVDVIVDATASRSRNSVIQRYGRGVRRHAGKPGLLYLDITDANPRDGRPRNRFAVCSHAREQALRAVGVQLLPIAPGTSAAAVYNLAEVALQAAPESPAQTG